MVNRSQFEQQKDKEMELNIATLNVGTILNADDRPQWRPPLTANELAWHAADAATPQDTILDGQRSTHDETHILFKCGGSGRRYETSVAITTSNNLADKLTILLKNISERIT